MIHTITLNPALDNIIYLNSFNRNITNRIKHTTTVLGGKGTHVSIDLKQLGKDNTAWGISFGVIGKTIIDMLEAEEIITQFLYYPERNSRTNYLIVEDSTDCTILSDKGVSLTDNMLDELITGMKKQIAPRDILVLSGDVSNCNPDIYNILIQELKSKHLSIYLDTSGLSLKECIKASPFLLKPNLDELSALCSIPAAELQTEAAMIHAIGLLDAYQIEVIALSLGGDGSIVKYKDDFYRIYPPENTIVINTIGCGDCYLSGLIAGFSEQMCIEDTLKLATAASAATAESSISSGFNRQRVKDFLNNVTIHKL